MPIVPSYEEGSAAGAEVGRRKVINNDTTECYEQRSAMLLDFDRIFLWRLY